MRMRTKWTEIRMLVWGTVMMIATVAACRRETPSADQGEALYRRCCASCHGVLGKGDGPAAESLQPKPADLTQLAEKYRGSYPVDEVMKAIDGRRTIRAHGDRTMPVGGGSV